MLGLALDSSDVLEDAERFGSNLGSNLGSYLFNPAELAIMAEVKIAEGFWRNEGNEVAVENGNGNGSGEDRAAVGDTLGETRKITLQLKTFFVCVNHVQIPGESEKGVAGGVPVDLGDPAPTGFGKPKIPDPRPDGEGGKGGGEAGDAGPPLELPGGLIRFSFWRLERDQA